MVVPVIPQLLLQVKAIQEGNPMDILPVVVGVLDILGVIMMTLHTQVTAELD
jgi:hypothetical protein